MSKTIFTCRVCGKEYEACRTFKKDTSVFHWRNVACCPEHGAIYLEQIRASRAHKEEVTTEAVSPITLELSVSELSVDIDDGFVEDE